MSRKGLEVSDLSVSYGRTEVLSNININNIQQGRVVGLLGQNAAGKSTLLKALAGQIKFKGCAEYNRQSLSEIPIHQRIALISYLPQIPMQASGLLVWEIALSMFHATSPQLSTAETEQRIQHAFERLELSPYAFRPIEELSGGKRQLLGLALMIARQPQLLLLDEPTSALDLRWQLETLTVVRKVILETRAISIIALHDINLALRFCDDIIMLSDGKVIAQGPASQVISRALLSEVYGVECRIETCSQGHLMVLADTPRPSYQQNRDRTYA